jgi:phage terminase large subunit-like protein
LPTSQPNSQPGLSRGDLAAALALQYAEQVVAGEIVACKQVRQACARHLRDLERSERGELPFVLSPSAVGRVCKFVEALPHPKGEWKARGETIKLEPWQCFILVSIFGWVERADPTRRRFQEADIFVPRKNAKSTIAAAIALYMFAADSEAGAEVYFLATSKEQATDLGFTPAVTMAEASPAYLKAFGVKVNKKSLTKPTDRAAVLKPLIGKPGDGHSPSAALVDEYHEHTTPVAYNAMKTGRGARRNPLLIVITTAGTDLASPCRQQQDYAEQVLDGTFENERLFCIIYTIDPEDDWTSELALRKANPNYGVSVDPVSLRNDQLEARDSAHKQAIYKTKHLNVWLNNATPWINPEEWKACADPELKLDDFAGEECCIGLDLADRIDLASKAYCFTREIDDARHFYLFGRHYQNEYRIEQAKSIPYAGWVEQGWVVQTPDNVTSYPVIADELVEDTKNFIVREVPHDPHHAGPLVQFIQVRDDWDQAAEFVEVQQNVNNFSPAMKEFEAAVLQRRIHHNGDPVLAWGIANCIARLVSRDLIVPDKKRAENKIDPAVASLMAFMRANVGETHYTDPRVIVA